MSKLIFIVRLAVLLTVYLHSSQADALTINTNFVPAGKTINGVGVARPQASKSVGGGDLDSIVRAAANMWESLILDDHTLTLNYGWYPTGSVSTLAYHQGLNAQGDPKRELLGSLAFNSEYGGAVPLFLDPTPSSSEEFGFKEQAFSDFGSGAVEVKREYRLETSSVGTSVDLYSIALHEIGHALGLVGWTSFEDETLDGDIDITIGSFSGSEIPVHSEHLNVAGPIMSSVGRPASIRRQITQTDLLAVCQLSGFNECHLNLRSVILPEVLAKADANQDDDVDGHDFLLWQRSQQPNAVSSLDLEAWRESYGASPYQPGDANHDGDVDGSDFLAWQRSLAGGSKTMLDLDRWQADYGFSSSQNFASFTVPEPGSVILALLAVALLLAGRRSHFRFSS